MATTQARLASFINALGADIKNLLRFASVSTQTSAVTLNVSSAYMQLVDATSAAFSVTLPSTTTPGIRLKFRKIDGGTNAVTLLGTFLNPGSNITNLKLYAVGQEFEIVTTTTADTFRVISSSPAVVPSGTAHANLPDGTLFVEYTP